ncbi:MAG: HDIG domain-containing protein [Calditrichaeota bacterium]|nr:HDIG domain-containing protein [Calditrichota bacterium]
MSIKKSWEEFLLSLEKYTVSDKPFREMALKTSYFIVLMIAIPLLFSTDNTIRYTDVKIGSVATKKVVAPYNFFILKTDEELQKERNQAVSRVPYYFNYDEQATLGQLSNLNGSLQFIKEKFPYIISDSLNQDIRNRAFQSKAVLLDSFGINLGLDEVITLNGIFHNKDKKAALNLFLSDIRNQLKDGILDVDPHGFKRELVAFIKNDIEEVAPKNRYSSLDAVYESLSKKAAEFLNKDRSFVLMKFVKQILKPNLLLNQTQTDKAVTDAIGSVSLTKDMVYENERIVDANERIDEEIYQKLYSLESARVERSKREGNWQPIFAQAGKVMLLGSILFIVGLYLFSFRKKIFADNKKLMMISVIILLQVVLAYIIVGTLNWPVYMIPTTIASMLLAILIDSGIGFVVTAAIGLILGGIQGGGYDITLMTVVSGMVAIYSVHEIRNRNQIFKAILYITLAYLWIIAAITFLRFDSLNNLIKIFSYNLLPNAIFAPFITYMLLGLFEKLFDITTDVRLLELSDLNHPLLKELSLKAPGTFHHSMVVGNLAEAAAKEIGENSLLTRVGSYYHDIGKMEKPEYFIENQMDANNRHSKLKPNMSALILASHVKTGMEMAEEHKLPRRICDFIAEHHGTSLMYFFYNKALAQAGDKDKLNESDFRYPGPKPRSKATAVVMIADTVEAASRTLKSPSPSKIRAFVEGLVHQKYKDGELDECDLTFKELKQIIDAFMPVLYGVFQHRVEYPESKDIVKNNSKEKKQRQEKVTDNGR